MISEYIELVESFKKNQISKLIETINLKIWETLNSPKFNSRIAPYFNKINKEGVPFTDFDLDPDNISQIKKVINALYYARLTFQDLENVDLRNINRTASDLHLLYSKTIHEAYQASYLLTHLDVDLKDMFSEEFEPLLAYYFTQFQHIAKNQSDKTKEIAEQLRDFPLSYKAGEVTGIVIEQMQPQSGDLDYNFLTQFSADLPGYIDKITQYISQYSSEIIEKAPNLNKEKIEELQNAAFKLLNDLENLKGNSLFLSFKVINYIHIIRNIITLSMSSLEQMGNLSESSQDVIRDNLAQLKYSILPTLFGLVDKIEDNAMLKPGTLSIPLMEKIKPLYDLLIYYASKPVNFQEKGEELLSIEDSRFLALRLERTYKRIDAANKSLFKIKKAQEACTDFFLILDTPEFRNMPLDKLPELTKEQLIKHYKFIKPYMKHIDMDFNNVIIDSLTGSGNLTSLLFMPWRWITNQVPANHISLVLEKKEALKNYIAKNIATQEFHITLNTDLIESVQKQTNLVLFPYAEPTNVFSIDESTALDATKASVSGLIFKGEEEHHLLTNPEQLTADQALDLYQWYRNRHNKFMVARNAYSEFITLLSTQEATKGDLLCIHQLDDGVKAQCRNLYNLFQPYFICGIPPEYKVSALNFDSFLVHAFSNREGQSTVPAENLFAKMNEHFQVFFSQIDLNWNKQSRIYLRWAKEKLEYENEASPLAKEINLENRAHHLIPHTHYSKFIHDFRMALFEVTAIFNEAMKTELKVNQESTPSSITEEELIANSNAADSDERGDAPSPDLSNTSLVDGKHVLAIKRTCNNLYHTQFNANQESPSIPGALNKLVHVANPYDTKRRRGVPYPELEDQKLTLAQCKQVLAIKRIFNCLYHVEGIILELESLTNRQYESKYVYHLLQAYGHINDIIKLSQGLAKDPHFALIGRQLLEKAQTIFATIQEHSDAYQAGPDEVLPSETVEYNALWYTLNAFFIFPKHVRALNNINYLTNQELNELHIEAKNSAIRIEKIINSSNSYFKLFLQTPNMYRLYRDLTNKLNEFISTSHNTMLDNLDKLRAQFITPMLIEADLWEDKLGLKPGILSDTLKTVTDEYYKGLLHPLGLDSKTHITLVCDDTPINTRIEITYKKIDSAIKHIDKLDKNYRYIEPLYALLQKYERLTGQGQSRAAELKSVQSELISTYQKALPKLVKIQKKLKLPPSLDNNDYKLDELLNSGIKKYDPVLNQIYGLIVAGHHNYLGIKSTYQLHLHSATEKLNYLTNLKEEQEKADVLFIEDYTAKSFERQMEELCNRDIGLHYIDKEYIKKLKEYILTFAQTIVNQAKTADDINHTIRILLKEKISLFEKEHFAPHYHLDTVRVALEQFKNYFSLSNSENSIFENEETLREKSKYIKDFLRIAENETLTLDERLEKIKFNVTNNARFQTVILAYKKADFFSFTYLIQCVVALLEALHFYTSARKALYNNLQVATTHQPQMSELTRRFGLFAAETPPPDELSAQEEITRESENSQSGTSEPFSGDTSQSLAEEWNTQGRQKMLVFIQQMNNTSNKRAPAPNPPEQGAFALQ